MSYGTVELMAEPAAVVELLELDEPFDECFEGSSKAIMFINEAAFKHVVSAIHITTNAIKELETKSSERQSTYGLVGMEHEQRTARQGRQISLRSPY